MQPERSITLQTDEVDYDSRLGLVYLIIRLRPPLL